MPENLTLNNLRIVLQGHKMSFVKRRTVILELYRALKFYMDCLHIFEPVHLASR
jgi:hypothetical protein